MIDNNNFRKLKGTTVNHLNYGKGTLSDFYLKNDGKYYVSVLFFSLETEKVFRADIAFKKKILILDDKELNETIIQLLDEHDIESLENEKKKSIRKSLEISDNERINNLIKKILKNEPIAIELIGFFDDEEFEKELCTEAFIYLERHINGEKLSNPHKACVVCALTLIALKYYDGDLHSQIEKKYREYRFETEYKYSKTSLQNGIYSVISYFKERVKYFDNRSYVAVPLVLSCVPHYRVYDLFKIAYDIYKKKLLFDEDISDNQIQEKVLETFELLRRKDLISDSDTIKGTNYLMCKYTQSCIFSGYGIDTLSQIVTHCIRLIICYLTCPEDSFTVEPYYYEGYSQWIKTFESDDKERAKYESSRTYSQPYIKLIQNEVYLVTGEYSMDDTADPGDVHICMYKDGVLIEDKLITDPNAIEYVDEESALGGYIIRRQELRIPGNPLGNLSYSIICSGKTIYDSKNRLHRSVIFFDGRGNEIKPGSKYNGELFVITKRSNKEGLGDRVNEIYRGADYYISTLEINNQEVLRFDDEPFVFNKITSAQLISYAIPWAEYYSAEGKRYPIYNDIIILAPLSCNKENVCLEIDGQRYYYGENKDISFSVHLYSKEYGGAWVYTAKVYGLEAGYHTISVINSISNKQIKGARFRIIYDPEIWKGFVSKNDEGILYEISGNIINKQMVFYEYGIPEIKLRTFVKTIGHGYLTIYPSSFSYSIDGITWFDVDRRIYLCDIPESIKTLYVCGPQKMTAIYIDEMSSVRKQEINITTDLEYPTKYLMHLAFLRTITDQKNARISFEYGNRAKYVNIWFNPYVFLNDCHFFYDKENKTHIFDIRFEGSSTIKANIKPLHSDDVLVSRIINNGELIQIKDEDIPEEVQFLTVSLHRKKYGALFDQYQKEPFMNFPKYDLGRGSVKVSYKINEEGGVLGGYINFDRMDSIKVEIVPNGFNTPLFTKEVFNGDRIALEVSTLPFNSYRFVFYSKNNDIEMAYNNKPFLVSKPVAVDSAFLKRIFRVSSFVLNDGTVMNTLYTIRFITIEEINQKYYLIASLMDKSKKIIYDDLAIVVKKRTGDLYKVSIRRRKDNGFIKLKFKSGKIVDGAYIEKIGD